MSETATAARPYARAVFELARDSGQVAVWSELMANLAALARMDDVRRLIAQPGIDDGKLSDVIAEAARAEGEQAQNFIRLLTRNRRLSLLPAIAEIFDKLRRADEQTVDVTVTTAVEVAEAQRSALSAAVERHLGRKADIHWEVDDSLIAGALIRAGDQVIDSTAAGALAQLRDSVIA